MLVLGVDPGTATTGYGLIKVENNEFEVITFGLIETEKNGDPGVRLNYIFNKMSFLLHKLSPDIVAIEKLFFAANTKTAIRVGQAQGVMLLSAAKLKLPVVEYAPGTVKKIVTGDGRADKIKVAKSVRKFLGARVRSKARKKTHFDNAADALAIAICHAFKKEVIKNE